MAIAHLAFRGLSKRVCSTTTTIINKGNNLVGCRGVGESSGVDSRFYEQKWMDGEWMMVKRFMGSSSSDEVGVARETSDAKQVEVSEKSKKSSLFPRKKGQHKRGLWRSNGRGEFVPALYEFFPSGLGNALLQATENINKLFENLNVSPTNLIGRFKEKDECYKLRYEVPGLSKEDLKIAIEDGVLIIQGEVKQEEESDDDDEYWASTSYGMYNASVMLPDDAKADEIKAELKDGVLHVTIPRSEKLKKDVQQVKVH